METNTIKMFGAMWCKDCRLAKRILDEAKVTYEYIDLEETPDAAIIAEEISGRKNIPVLLYPDGTHQTEPSAEEIRTKLSTL